MDILFQFIAERVIPHFTFMLFGLTLLQLWVLRHTLSRPGQVFLGVVAFLFLMIGFVQMITGYHTMMVIWVPPQQAPLVALFWGMLFPFLWGSTWWVLRGEGAEMLSRHRILGRTEREVKIFFLVMSVVLPILFLINATMI